MLLMSRNPRRPKYNSGAGICTAPVRTWIPLVIDDCPNSLLAMRSGAGETLLMGACENRYAAQMMKNTQIVATAADLATSRSVSR